MMPLYMVTVVMTSEPPKQSRMGTWPNVLMKPSYAGLWGNMQGGMVQTLLFPFPKVRASR